MYEESKGKTDLKSKLIKTLWQSRQLKTRMATSPFSFSHLEDKEVQRLYQLTKGLQDPTSRKIRNVLAAREISGLVEPGEWV